MGEPLPTIAFATDWGVWWIGGEQPRSIGADNAHVSLRWSVDEDLGLWALQCEPVTMYRPELPVVVGELARPTAQLIRCTDSYSMQGFGFVVAVLPTEVASEAALVEAEHEVDSPVHVSGQPQIVDLGAGRSLWTMDVSDNRPRGDDLVPVHPELNIEGLDLDDDGMVDVPWQ